MQFAQKCRSLLTRSSDVNQLLEAATSAGESDGDGRDELPGWVFAILFLAAIVTNRAAKQVSAKSERRRSLYQAKSGLLSALISLFAERVDCHYQQVEGSGRMVIVKIADPITGLVRSFHTPYHQLSGSARTAVYNRVGSP